MGLGGMGEFILDGCITAEQRMKRREILGSTGREQEMKGENVESWLVWKSKLICVHMSYFINAVV